MINFSIQFLNLSSIGNHTKTMHRPCFSHHHSTNSTQFLYGTCVVPGSEALPLHGRIGFEDHEHLVGGGHDGVGHLSPAIPAQLGGLGAGAVV